MSNKEEVVVTLEHMDNLTEVQKVLCEVNNRNCTYCPMYIASGLGSETCGIIRTIEFLRDSL